VKNYLIILVLLCFVKNVNASHIVGGDMYYDCLGGNSYRITLTLYRDCLSDGAEFDPNVPVTIFNGLNAQIGKFYIPFPGSSIIDAVLDNPCITVPADICVEQATYQQVVELPPSTTGYTLSYQRCCRGPAVVNLFMPEDQGLTLTVDIPPSEDAICNNSARFSNYPPLVICANNEFDFDHSAVDPDGDELVYELCTPYQGGTSAFPAPDPSSAPPYDLVVWGASFSEDDPFGMGDLTIDPTTGMLTIDPEVPGLYAVGVCAKEYRDGVLISTTRRDFLFKVLNCDIELTAEITEQEDLPTFTSYCDGLEISFVNESFGGEFFNWDFGVPGITTDVSSEFNPTYIFPAAGTYEVTMIVNPGWPCTDTAIETFVIYETFDVDFDVPDPQCIIDNNYDFLGTGDFPDEATFIWDFGGLSTPLTSESLAPTDVVFSVPGLHDVTFSAFYEVCEASVTKEVKVFAEPSIMFTVPDELKCVPYTARFTNMSFADTPLYYDWDFGHAGATSTLANPTHVYDEVGVFTVSLTVWTDSGCIDTLNLVRENLIEVFPSPTSSFTVSPEEQDEYHADFYFEDNSVDAVEQWYYFMDGDYSPEPNTWHNYKEPGVYYPYQIVTNEYGCQDRSYQKLTVIPVIPVIVPNAFTPDGDDLNNVFRPVFYESQPFDFYIYNRWGELIHESHTADAYWDGSFNNGQLVEDGIYIWRIVYHEYDTDLPVELQGHVVVLK
jgi:gliding motility-associated-like protein